jgi:hypothetical protein
MKLVLAPGPHLPFRAVLDQLAEDAGVLQLDQGERPLARGLLHEQAGKRAVVEVEALDQERLALLQAGRVVDQDVGQGFPAGIGHERARLRCGSGIVGRGGVASGVTFR